MKSFPVLLVFHVLGSTSLTSLHGLAYFFFSLSLCISTSHRIPYHIFSINSVLEQANSFSYFLLKLINYSFSQKPINDLHLVQVDEF